MTELGTMTSEGTTCTLRFERLLPHAPAEVWAALTEPDRLGEWLAAAEVEPGLGGTITLDFGEGRTEDCRITVWDPPRALAYRVELRGRDAVQRELGAGGRRGRSGHDASARAHAASTRA